MAKSEVRLWTAVQFFVAPKRYCIVSSFSNYWNYVEENFCEFFQSNVIGLLFGSSWKGFLHESLPMSLPKNVPKLIMFRNKHCFKTFIHITQIFLIIRFWAIYCLLLTTLWRIQHKNYLVLRGFKRVQRHDCWKPWTSLSEILHLFTIQWKKTFFT